MKVTGLGSVCGAMRRMAWRLALGTLIATAAGGSAGAQGVSTTTVQGTVYLANGQPGGGALVVSWPSFTTAAGQAIAADQMTVAIPADGFVSLNLAANQGATPAGEYYTVTYYMSDGSTNTEYWVVPAAAQATIAQVRAQVMPAAQAVQAVTKAYVDQSIAELQLETGLATSGGTLTGPLTLSGDPTQPLQAADKHYVDSQAATAVPLSGGAMTGPLILSTDPTQAMQAADKEYVDAAAANAWPAMVLRVDEFAGADFGARLQACLNAVNTTYGGICDARNFSGNQAISSNLTVSAANTTILLPCATIATANHILVAAGTRNVALRGCSVRGGSTASGSQGGTVLAYSGAAALIQVGDPTYATDTVGFHLDNLAINTTAGGASALGLAAYRTQEIEVAGVYLLGNSNQTGMTLDGTGNYTGGTFIDDQLDGFQTAVNAIGHQVPTPATTDWMNASSFVRLHINCPTSSGNPIAGTYGLNLQQGDGNTITGGDVEGCATALHLGPNAQNNTIVGLRTENSTMQVVADPGSSYNDWIGGEAISTGQLSDSGTRNSFQDSFHRGLNGMNGDWYGSQQDATLTNHFRLGTGAGNERGLLNRYQTDYGYRWTTGLSDAASGEQFYEILDELNNVNRLSIGQYNNGQSSTNNQTAINSAGTGAVVLNGSNNAGTGGVVIGSGGASESTVATISNTGSAQFNGALQVGGTAQFGGAATVRNNADAEVDSYLWPGLTASQKGAFTYKDWNGNNQWSMVKDASNNWALNSSVGGLDSFKAYQSTNGGDTYVDAAASGGTVRMNYESGSGTAFKVYGGNSSTVYASFTGAAAIAFPGLAASSGYSCLQIDSSGNVTNTGSACGSGSGGSGTVNSSNAGYIAYYPSNGTSVTGVNSVPVTAGGTGATTAAGALANLGALPLAGGTLVGPISGTSGTFSGSVSPATVQASGPPVIDIRNPAYGAICDGGTHSIDAALQAAVNAAPGNAVIEIVGGNSANVNTCYWADPPALSCDSKTLTLKIFGTLQTGTTLTTSCLNIVGAGGAGQESQFTQPNTLANVLMWPNSGSASGTLGTQVYTTTGTISSGALGQITLASGTGFAAGSQIVVQGAAGSSDPLTTTLGSLVSGTTYNISPAATTAVTNAIVGSIVTFTPSSMVGIDPGTGIYISGTTSCSPTSISRSSNVVTAVCAAGTHIPADVQVTVASCADSTYNGSFTVTSDDYPSGTFVWTNSGSNGSTSGCTISGFNEDTAESVQITATTPTTATAQFWRSHSASDSFGIWAVELVNQASGQLVKNISISGTGGRGLWMAGQYLGELDNVNIGACGGTAYEAMEVSSGAAADWSNSYNSVKNSTFDVCEGSSPWSVRLTQYQYLTWAQSGQIYFDNDWFQGGGIKVDHGFSGVYLDHTVFEEPSTRGAILFDGTNYWSGSPQVFQVSRSMQQDSQGCWIYQEAPASVPNAYTAYLDHNIFARCDTNAYFSGKLKTDSQLPDNTPYETAQGRSGVYAGGDWVDAESPEEQAGLGPSVVPFPTANIPQNPASWTGGCSVTAGAIAPDGTATAGALTYNTANSNAIGYLAGLTPAVGDTYLFGAWVYTPTPNVSATGTNGVALIIDNSNSTHFTLSQKGVVSAYGQGTTAAWDPQLYNEGWHPVVGMATVASSDGTGSQQIRLNLQCSSSRTMEYWNPWLMEIPASAGLTNAEIQGIRKRLMHGSVPPNYNGPGIAATNEAISTNGYYVPNASGGAPTAIIPGTAALPYIGFKTYTGTGTPTDTCSATANTGAIEINATPTAYQCSNATGSYAWNALGGTSGVTSITASSPLQASGSTGAVTLSCPTCAGNFTAKLASTPLDNTGSTSATYLGTITIPAGTMGPASQLIVQAYGAACRGVGGTPTSACTTSNANTGTCTLTAYFSNTSGASGTTSSIFYTNGSASVTQPFSAFSTIANTSATTQQIGGYGLNYNVIKEFPDVGGTVNTANASYINFFLTNSVSADNCFITSANAQLIP